MPLVSVPDAALHNGQLTIRRSPLLELRTLSRSGVTRTDLPGDAARRSAGGEESPLGIRPFEAYSFAAVPFTLRLAAAPVAARVSATVQTVLRIADYERSLESRVTFDVQGRPVYQLQMFLPEDFQRRSRLGPRRVPICGHAAGRAAAVDDLPGRGPAGQRAGAGARQTRPRGRTQGTAAAAAGSAGREDRQQGDVAVQVDPAFDVDAADLENCETVLLGRLYAWLNPEQRRVTRLGLHYARGDYAGTLRLTPRKADVVCDTITNVRVTDRAIEETILLDFTIQQRGHARAVVPAARRDGRQPDQRADAAAEDDRAGRARRPVRRCACGSSCRTR